MDKCCKEIVMDKDVYKRQIFNTVDNSNCHSTRFSASPAHAADSFKAVPDMMHLARLCHSCALTYAPYSSSTCKYGNYLSMLPGEWKIFLESV